ncbi:formylglycine-generating enzyme family protein [Stenotrophomonas rhizophila]|uniref:formylglycine-generating enzyme family protein n=1 Tax=Stenotrophomonas rhizophila TaxID=216778 RepID=UPI00215B0617|nr:formylglycine-generating enzyme family protein [Stenotrophomonas rhizophila]
MTLPTEAQWEYAARAGGKMRVYATDNGELDNGRNVSSIAQYEAFASKHGRRTRESSLGAFPPNPLGFYDIVDHGREWVSDWYAPEYDPKQIRNPTGPASGTERVQRSSTDRDADQLSITSMTMTRSHQAPEQGPVTFADGEVLESIPIPIGATGSAAPQGRAESAGSGPRGELGNAPRPAIALRPALPESARQEPSMVMYYITYSTRGVY